MPYFFTSAMPFPTATLAGIETAHMIRKGQFGANGHTAFQQFAALAA
jgi:putative transposase